MADKKKILLVDDDNDLLEQMKMGLISDFDVSTANSGEECLEMLKGSTPDLIVMDVMMKTLSDGLDTAKKLKEDDETKDIPVIMLTSVNEHYDYRDQMGADYFPNDKWLDKPVKPGKLIETINQMLS